MVAGGCVVAGGGVHGCGGCMIAGGVVVGGVHGSGGCVVVGAVRGCGGGLRGI